MSNTPTPIKSKKTIRLELVLSGITDEWSTYHQIYKRLNGKISIGGISNVIWTNVKEVKNKIEWRNEIFGNKEWQMRMIFRKLPNQNEQVNTDTNG